MDFPMKANGSSAWNMVREPNGGQMGRITQETGSLTRLQEKEL